MTSTTFARSSRLCRQTTALILAASMPGCTIGSLQAQRELSAPLAVQPTLAPLPDPPAPLKDCMRKAGFRPDKETVASLIKAQAAENVALRKCLQAWPEWYKGVQEAQARQTGAKDG